MSSSSSYYSCLVYQQQQNQRRTRHHRRHILRTYNSNNIRSCYYCDRPLFLSFLLVLITTIGTTTTIIRLELELSSTTTTTRSNKNRSINFVYGFVIHHPSSLSRHSTSSSSSSSYRRTFRMMSSSARPSSVSSTVSSSESSESTTTQSLIQHQQQIMPKQPLQPPKVIIIGAGFSGLAVAYHLLTKPMITMTGSSSGGRTNDDDNNNSISSNDVDSNNSNGNSNSHGTASTTTTASDGLLLRPDVQILEARDRIGGRVYPYTLVPPSTTTTTTATSASTTTSRTSTVIDLGGQWVHEASNNNPFCAMIQNDLGINFIKFKDVCTKGSNVRDDKNVLFDYEDGTIIDPSIIKCANAILDQALDGDDDDHNYDDDPATAPSYRYLVEEEFNEYLLAASSSSSSSSSSNVNIPLLRRTMNGLIHEIEEYEGGKIEDMSSADWYVNLGGPDEVPHGTYKTVLDGIMNTIDDTLVKRRQHDNNMTTTTSHKIGNDGDDSSSSSSSSSSNGVDDGTQLLMKDRLHLNKRVIKIEYDPFVGGGVDGGDDSIDRENGGVYITVVDNGSDDGDDDGINTKSKTTTTTTTTTYHCDYCVCTVPLGVLQRHQQEGGIEFVPPLPRPKQTAIQSIGMGLLNKIVMQFDTRFWGELKQFGITHSDPSMVKTYYDCTEDFDADESSYFLVQFSAGDAALRVDSPNGLSDEGAVEDSLDALRRVFERNDEGEGGTAVVVVPTPIASKVTRWMQDEYARGAYSFPKVGSTPTMYDDLAHPVGNLLFAGEHTSKESHSTVHGAWITGQREAERIQKQILLTRMNNNTTKTTTTSS